MPRRVAPGCPGWSTGEEVVYAVLPLFHAYGLTLCLTFAISIGATLVLFPRFDAQQVLDAMGRRPATFLPGVPPIYRALADAAVERGVDLHSIRFALSGAMPLPTTIVDHWEAATGGLLVEGYGMTETSPVTIGNPLAPTRRPGTVGVPFPSTEIRIVDPNDPTQDCEEDDAGELLVRGPQVFAGYWNRPEDTAATLLDGGWIRTGDIVVMDRDGFVTIVDRIKELIITGGFNVYPSQVEEVLEHVPGVDRGRRRRAAGRLGRRAGGRRRRRGAGRAPRPRAGARRDAGAPHRVQGAAAGVRPRRAAALAHRQGPEARGAHAPARAPRPAVVPPGPSWPRDAPPGGVP